MQHVKNYSKEKYLELQLPYFSSLQATPTLVWTRYWNSGATP